MDFSKKELAIFLSKLEVFENPSFDLEQYHTDSDIAATWLWDAYMAGDIEGKEILDAACGPGILGIAALLLGAKKVTFLDLDKKIIETLKRNLDLIEPENYEILNIPIEEYKGKVDVILQNPPFGTKIKHADRAFLVKGFVSADKIYSLHKTSTTKFLEAVSDDYGFSIVRRQNFEFPIPKSMKHHKKKRMMIDTTLFVLQKI